MVCPCGIGLNLLSWPSIVLDLRVDLIAYNAFIRYGQRDKQWCGNHRINQKALLRAVSIRKQLKKYLDRFGIPVVSCEGDAVRLRKCLVSGYFKVSPYPSLITSSACKYVIMWLMAIPRMQLGCNLMGRTVQHVKEPYCTFIQIR